MPRISAFYGITVHMFFGDHLPPHFHARYGEYRLKMALDGNVLEGELPPRALGMLRPWAGLHRSELEARWDRVVRHEAPGTIPPLA
jgi:hypothetical protein